MTFRFIPFVFACAFASLAMADPWLKTNYENAHVVIPPDASGELQSAASDFVRLWKNATGTEISYSTENTGDICVWLGKEIMPPSLADPALLEGLGPDGFIIRTYSPNRRDYQYHIGPHLVIAGQSDAATHHGVIEFFDRYLGFHWLMPGSLQRPPLEEMQPANLRFQTPFRFREVGYHGMWHGEKTWDEWRRMNHLPELFQPSHRRYPLDPVPAMKPVDLALPQTAEDAFAWIKANAGTAGTELPRGVRTVIWKDDQGLDVVCWTLNRIPGLDPALDHLSVEDLPKAVDLASKIAQALADKPTDAAPCVRLALPASSPLPPQGLALDARVVVQLSDAACDHSRPLLDRHCEANAQFMEALEAWSKTGATLFVSHHVCSLHNNIAPFPNIHVLRDNLYAFTQYNVQGVYAESWDYPEVRHAEQARLRGYILARLLWNPDQVLEDLVEQFRTIYYGPAAEQATAFHRAFQSAMEGTEIPLSPVANSAWLKVDAVESAEKALGDALKLELSSKIRPRIEELLSTLEYAQLVCPPTETRDSSGKVTLRRPKSRSLEQVMERLQKRGLGKDPHLDLMKSIADEAAVVTK